MKKILCLFIICILTCINSFAAFPQISKVTFENESGTVEYLTPGEKITASVTVSNCTEGDSFSFLLTLGTDEKITDSDIMILTADSTEETLSAQLTMPADVSGLKLKAMLWKDLCHMEPLTAASLLPGGEEGIKYILADGEMISGFSADINEYYSPVENSKLNAPYIFTPAFDGKTSVDIKTTMKFPGKSEITVTSFDDVKTSYLIEYETPGNDLSDSLVSVISDESKLCHKLSNGASPYADNENVTVENIPDELIGSSYITAGTNYSSDPLWTGENKDWYSVNFKRTAKIFFFSENEISEFETVWDKASDLSLDIVNRETGEYLSLKNVYSKKVITEEETVVSIQNPSCDCGNFFIVIAYEYAEVGNQLLSEEENLTGLKYKGALSDSESGDTYFDQPVKCKNFNENSKLFKDNDELTATAINENLVNCEYIITNRMKGSTNGVVKNSYGGQDSLDWYSFELKKSATVMIFPDSAYGDALSNASTDFIKSELTDGSYFSLYNNTWNNIHSERKIMYSKYITVPDGESVTVNIPNAPKKRNDVWAHLVLVDYGLNPLHKEATERGIVSDITYEGPSPDGVEYGVKYNAALSEGNAVWLNNSNVHFKNIHSEIVGKPYIIMDSVKGSSYNSQIASAWFGSATDWITFKINKSARIKVVTDGDTLKHCGSYGYTKATESVKYFDAYNTPWNTVHTEYNTMYYKDVEVPEGETVTVTIPNAPTWTTQSSCKLPHVIIIDFAE